MTHAVPLNELSSTACREQAAVCRTLANQAMTIPHRVLLEHIAKTWDRIASDIDSRMTGTKPGAPAGL